MKREHSEQSQLPSGYRQLEYIESTGTQWMTLPNYMPTTSAVVRVRYRLTTASTSIFQAGKGITRLMMYPVNSTRIDYCYGKGYKTLTVQQGDNEVGVWYDTEMDYRTLKVNGHVYNIDGTPNVNTDIDLHLFSTYFGSGDFIVRPIALSYISIADGNGGVYLVAALREYDSKPGMYDLCGSICPLTGTPFYVNAGSGEFLYQ